MSKKSDKSRKSAGGESDVEDSWVFDSLVGFLRGPVWNVPILTFIEHKSLIFEPEIEDQNDVEYKKIHDEYKNLVDFMLGSYMEDIGITSDQFEKACGRASGKIRSQFHHAVFEQVWAADDYEIFKRMMIQKNIELQLQALELLQQKYGVLPASLRPGGDDGKQKTKKKVTIVEGDDSEAKVMEEVVRKSMAEHHAMASVMDKEKRELEMAMARSMIDQQRLQAQKQTQQDILAEHFKNKVSISDPSLVIGTSGLSSSGGVAMADSTVGSGSIDAADLAKRTEFLKGQRDKLLAMKKAEREKQLEEVEKAQLKSRPKSARAARSAMGGGRGNPANNIDPVTLKARRALAEKLKQEVIAEYQTAKKSK